jgi:urease accessory protein
LAIERNEHTRVVQNDSSTNPEPKRSHFGSFATMVLWLATATSAAQAHPAIDSADSFIARYAHPLSGLDHIAVMVAVGFCAALKGGRALWIWPAAFIGVVLVGALLGVAQVSLPFVEPAILGSLVVMGLVVATAAKLPFWIGAALIGSCALFHGHAHGAEMPETVHRLGYMAAFVATTAALQLAGIGITLYLSRRRLLPLIRATGAAAALIGIAMGIGAM